MGLGGRQVATQLPDELSMHAAHLSLQHGAPLGSACRACQEEDCHGLHGEELEERPAIRRLLVRMGPAYGRLYQCCCR